MVRAAGLAVKAVLGEVGRGMGKGVATRVVEIVGEGVKYQFSGAWQTVLGVLVMVVEVSNLFQLMNTGHGLTRGIGVLLGRPGVLGHVGADCPAHLCPPNTLLVSGRKSHSFKEALNRPLTSYFPGCWSKSSRYSDPVIA